LLEPGEIIDGRFEVEALIGEGGLAQVFRVRHIDLGSLHALKLLSWRKKSLADRLMLEGRIQAQLNHPNIVAVTDLVRHDGQFGLLMEYVDNQSLEELLTEKGGLGLELGLELFAPILSAVTAAHDAGVTHRDLKPANVLLALSARGLLPKVTDFGIAKVVADVAGGSTAVGSTMGTPGYLAPEQIQDSSTIDARADIFALGAICYELITGRRAFANEAGVLEVASTMTVVPRPLATWVAETPSHVQEALTKAMAKDPAERFSDCRSFAAALYSENPALQAMVEGQVLTGTLSLSGSTTALSRADEPPRPTLLPSVDAPPTQERTSEGGRGVWLVLGALAAGGLVLAVVGGLGAAVLGDAMLGDPVVPQPVETPAPTAPAPTAPAPTAPAPTAPAPTAPAPTAPAPMAPAPTAPAPTAPAPTAPAPTVPAPQVAVPEPVAPTPVLPEPVEVPSPAPPEPTVVLPAPVPVAAVAPPPEPAPVAQPPELGGAWSGKAARRPLRMDISSGTTSGIISGNVVFPGPGGSRSEKLTGTVTPDGVVSLRAAEFVFTGRLNGSTLSGTYQSGGGKRLDWTVSR